MLAQLADRPQVRERTRCIFLPLSFDVPWVSISHFETVSSDYRRQKGMVQTGRPSVRDGPLGYMMWSLEQQQKHLFHKQPLSKQHEHRAEELTESAVYKQQRPVMFKETVKEKGHYRTEALKKRPPKWHKKIKSIYTYSIKENHYATKCCILDTPELRQRQHALCRDTDVVTDSQGYKYWHLNLIWTNFSKIKLKYFF